MTTDIEEIHRAMREADCLATPAEVSAALDRMAVDITAQLADSNPLVYTVMNGGLIFAGRLLSRHAALKRKHGAQVRKELEDKGIWVFSAGIKTLAEEMPEAYKDVDDVVEAVAGAGLSKRVARLRPMGVVKG